MVAVASACRAKAWIATPRLGSPRQGLQVHVESTHRHHNRKLGRAATQPLFYTNAQLKLLMSPDRAPLPYMYDNFAWPHCEMLGYTMSNRLADYGLADDAANATEAETVYAFDFKAQ